MIVQITFHVVAELCQSHPARIQRIAEAGHELACHGWRHERPRDLSARGIDVVLGKVGESFAALGLKPVGFRSPQSAWSAVLVRRLAARGYRWNAERDRAVAPYRITGQLVRVPIRADDWDLVDGTSTAPELLQRWRSIVADVVGKRQVIVLGLHEWMVGRCGAFADGLDQFLGDLRAGDGVRVGNLGELATS